MVIWTKSAEADLRGIHDFISHNSKFYAKRVVQDIREKSDKLEIHPFIGRVVAEIGDNSIREISIYSYRIIYQLTEQQTFILTIAHKRQSLTL
ncbi:Plasmid stabilization system [Crenothrix polyspora]|uniref:Plasmid stabilization system n=1 Tax=Crenothrix polyspora TaxID=360316 RepID=A0A1R4H1D6_9GAMM|nr:type II toxin-antitoxin system RelE/ParE family toxin [Crenothrix polyspora]SJM90016.1 Plasmid stabilization system [Crenothrix polyspora]